MLALIETRLSNILVNQDLSKVLFLKLGCFTIQKGDYAPINYGLISCYNWVKKD